MTSMTTAFLPPEAIFRPPPHFWPLQPSSRKALEPLFAKIYACCWCISTSIQYCIYVNDNDYLIASCYIYLLMGKSVHLHENHKKKSQPELLSVLLFFCRLRMLAKNSPPIHVRAKTSFKFFCRCCLMSARTTRIYFLFPIKIQPVLTLEFEIKLSFHWTLMLLLRLLTRLRWLRSDYQD